MAWYMRHQKADGTVEIQKFEDDESSAAKALPRKVGPDLSLSAAVPINQYKRAKEIDERLGVNSEYRVSDNGTFAYKVHRRGTKDKWLRAHKWVDHNAGYGTPRPGDFVPKDQYVPKPGPRIVRVANN